MVENQGVFLKNRGVAPTALAGLALIHHVVHSFNSSWHRANIAIKLDLSKAFDRVEWNFLITIMQKLKFPNHLISLIHHCLISTQIAVRFNQQKTSYFSPPCGLRQGDPLSPLLFILCIQGLSMLLNESLFSERWQPIFIKKNPLSITYRTFADDIILFLPSFHSGNARTFKRFHIFSPASGKRINFSKSNIIFH